MNKQKEKPMDKGVIIQGIMPRMWYTQREWDRTVGYGLVPDEYKEDKDTDKQTVKKEGETK